jgi:hypothetical protein
MRAPGRNEAGRAIPACGLRIEWRDADAVHRRTRQHYLFIPGADNTLDAVDTFTLRPYAWPFALDSRPGGKPSVASGIQCRRGGSVTELMGHAVRHCEVKPGLGSNLVATALKWTPVCVVMWAGLIFGVSRLIR